MLPSTFSNSGIANLPIKGLFGKYCKKGIGAKAIHSAKKSDVLVNAILC
tara:strand:- start:4257 stop:4403 length:147 start_codon:yes stop_codon:yes gene_type:complete